MNLGIEKGTFNFLDLSEKCTDWRYSAYQNIFSAPRGTRKVIHWIGIIRLGSVSKTSPLVPMYFLSQQKKMTQDVEILRYEDGREIDGPNNTKVILYDISKIHDVLITIKEKKKYNYFNVFVEEWVDRGGMHNVHLLYNPREIPIYGTETKKPWFEESAIGWIDCYSQKVTDKTERIFLLSNGEYLWLK